MERKTCKDTMQNKYFIGFYLQIIKGTEAPMSASGRQQFGTVSISNKGNELNRNNNQRWTRIQNLC